MNQCQECKQSLKKVSKKTKIYINLPFEERLPFNFCEKCNKKTLDQNAKNLIKELEQWSLFEHTGEHLLNALESKDHYKKKQSSGGILGEAPKGIYIDLQNKRRYLIKWSKVRPDKFSHGLREVATEFIMNKMAEKIASTARSSLGKIGTSPVFVSESFIENGENHLIHGVEIFRTLYGDDEKINTVQKSRKLQKKFYTLEHIKTALQNYYKSSYSPLIKSFYKMILADAWPGNQDRHSENWGVIKKKSNYSPPPSLL